MNEYKITDDGFGIRIFDLSISHLCKDEPNTVMERIFSEQSNISYEKKHANKHIESQCCRQYKEKTEIRKSVL